MTTSYWSKYLDSRVTRRRALALAGGSAAASAFLAACGTDDDDVHVPVDPVDTPEVEDPEDVGGVVQPAHSPPDQAVRGGVLKDWMNAEPRSLDPINPQANLNRAAAHIYSTLFKEAPGFLEPSQYQLTGDVAESFEVSPDGLQLTIHLRDGIKWHPKAPVNNRDLDVEDVLFSMRRHAEMAPLRDLVWEEVSGSGFALTPSAPDSSTVVIPLAEPVAYAINWFGAFGSFTGQVLMYPKETDDTFNIAQDMIGTGPFYLREHVPSVRFVLARNPDYWDQDFVLVDEMSQPVLPEYITRQGQLKAGEIYRGDSHTDILRAEDILITQSDQPGLALYTSPLVTASSVMTFGWQGEDRFKDERVRQAISMAFDRDLDIEVRYNVAEFEQAGLPLTTAWNSHLAARGPFQAAGWWLDPQGPDFGPNARYFQHNPEEAKKLLTAAGYPDGFEVRFSYPNAPQFDRGSLVEPYFFYLQNIGLHVIDGGQTDYTQDYIPNNRDASGEFDGIGYHSVTGGIPVVVSPTSALVAEHLPTSGVTFHGYSVGGGGGRTGDPELIAILERAKVERDEESRKALVQDAQRHLAKAMWSLLEPGGSSNFYLAWPAVRNFRVWEAEGFLPWRNYQIWLDETKAPFV